MVGACGTGIHQNFIKLVGRSELHKAKLHKGKNFIKRPFKLEIFQMGNRLRMAKESNRIAKVTCIATDCDRPMVTD